jgi:TRAP-type C4-dicarboxylate transport system permease large subunit
MNDRGQSIGIARFFLALMVGAIMYWIATLVTDPLLAGSRNATNNATANQATQWFEQGVAAIPLAVTLIAFVGIIALSVFMREVDR